MLSNVIDTQISIHEKFGGVVPEIASRNHVEAISNVMKKAIDDAKDVILQTLDNEILVDTLHLRLEQLKAGGNDEMEK